MHQADCIRARLARTQTGDQRFELALLLAADEVALLLAAPLVLALLADELVALLLAAPLLLFVAENPGALKHRAATAIAMVRRFMKHHLSYGNRCSRKGGFSRRLIRRVPDCFDYPVGSAPGPAFSTPVGASSARGRCKSKHAVAALAVLPDTVFDAPLSVRCVQGMKPKPALFTTRDCAPAPVTAPLHRCTAAQHLRSLLSG